LLRLCRAEIPEIAVEGSFAGIDLKMPPHVVLLPSFGTSLTDVKARFSDGASLTMTSRSSLVLEGDVIFTGKVTIDGALVIKAQQGATVTVKDLAVSNAGWSLVAVDRDAEDEFVRMRGYQVTTQWPRSSLTSLCTICTAGVLLTFVLFLLQVKRDATAEFIFKSAGDFQVGE
jgi:hypothetical protein